MSDLIIIEKLSGVKISVDRDHILRLEETSEGLTKVIVHGVDGKLVFETKETVESLTWRIQRFHPEM